MYILRNKFSKFSKPSNLCFQLLHLSPSFVEASSFALTMRNAHVVVDTKTFLFSLPFTVCYTTPRKKREKRANEMKIFHHNNREMMGNFVP